MGGLHYRAYLIAVLLSILFLYLFCLFAHPIVHYETIADNPAQSPYSSRIMARIAQCFVLALWMELYFSISQRADIYKRYMRIYYLYINSRISVISLSLGGHSPPAITRLVAAWVPGAPLRLVAIQETQNLNNREERRCHIRSLLLSS